MITLNDIKKSIVKKLGEVLNDVNIFAEDISQVQNANDVSVYPFIHVGINPLSEILEAGAQTRYTTILIDLSVVELEKSNEAMYERLDNLSNIIGAGIKTEDRFFTVENINMNIVDGMGHLLFYINFSNGFEIEEEDAEKMGELRLKI